MCPLFIHFKITHMKRLSILFATIVLSFPSLCATAQQKGAKHIANKSSNMPYKMEYTNLRIGNDQYSMKVLNAWKAYDDGDLDRVADMLADEVWATLPDGTVLKGKEAFLNGLKTYRASFASAVSTVTACTTLKSAEHPESDATVIWGIETDTKKDGTVQKTALHEVWFFNKAGKVFEFHQYAAAMMDEKQ